MTELEHMRSVRDRMEYDGYGADKRSGYDRLPDRPLDPPDLGNLTDAEVNAVQAEIEQRAEDEMLEGSERFTDWLHNNKRILRDWQQHRAAMLTEEEQIDIEKSLGIRP